MATTPREKLSRFIRIAGFGSTMPWICLQAPIEQILQEPDVGIKDKQLTEWRVKKNSELEMVSFAGTLVASAVTGSIQWSTPAPAHWIVSAAWYSTLLFSLVSVVMAFYLSILFSNFAVHNDGNTILLRVLHKTRDPTKSRWASLFALQMPIMLLSYALILYILGLSLMVIRPLWVEPWGNSSFVAIWYCVFLFLVLLGSGAVYHFIAAQSEDVLKF